MGRRPRVEFEGAIYHVIHRGNNREYIFKENEDKGYLLDFIEEVMEDFPFKLLGYVIMDNHYHLMIETHRTPLQKIMQRLNNKYSKSYNRRYCRSGHVFGGRYIIGVEEDDLYKQQGDQKRSLNDILLETGVNKDDFVLIKKGSRKRYLRNYKIKYVKAAVTEGYTFKEIGRNISVSAEAANQMSKSIIKRAE